MADRKRTCVLCHNKAATLHFLPRMKEIRDKWLIFIYGVIPEKYPTSDLVLCSEHFQPEDFLNLGEYSRGFSSKLRLNHAAVPSRRSPSTSLAEASQLIHTTYITKAKVSLGTQTTDLVLTKSVGTQLSCTTLKNHVRSKATQTIPQERRGVENIPQFQLLYMPGRRSAASLHCRAAETPGLEEQTLLKENVEEQQDQSDESLKEVGEMSRMNSVPSGVDCVVVLDQNLFKTCPVCKSDCEVQQKGSGTSLSFSQFCSKCQYSKLWRRHPPTESSHVPNFLKESHRVTSFVLVEEKRDNEANMDRLPGLYRRSDIQAAAGLETSNLEKLTPQHIVDEEAIMQLAKHCPICRKRCRCGEYRRGPYMVIYQKCYFCHYQHKWANQPEAQTLKKRCRYKVNKS